MGANAWVEVLRPSLSDGLRMTSLGGIGGSGVVGKLFENRVRSPFPVTAFLGTWPISMGTLSISWHQRRADRLSWLAAGGLLL